MFTQGWSAARAFQQLAIDPDRAACCPELHAGACLGLLDHIEGLKALLLEQLWPGVDVRAPHVGGFENGKPLSGRAGFQVLGQNRLDFVAAVE